MGSDERFDAVLAQYLDATAGRDLARLAEVLHPRFIGIFPDGEVLDGRTAALAWFGDFFADPSWIQTFTERHRVFSGLASFVLFDSEFVVPSTGYRSHLVIGLSFTYERGRWMLLADQNTQMSAERVQA